MENEDIQSGFTLTIEKIPHSDHNVLSVEKDGYVVLITIIDHEANFLQGVFKLQPAATNLLKSV